jgi:hypothetical protein
MNKNQLISKIAYIFIAVLVVLLTRTVFRIGYNVEFVTAFSFAAGFFFKDRFSGYLVPIAALFVTDIIIGNTIIAVFTWSGFLFPVILGKIVNKFSNSKSNFIINEFSGIVSTFFFFFWTNFGVVSTSKMYTKDLAGLADSYINGLPFLYNQILGNIILVPCVFFLSRLLFNMNLDEKFSGLRETLFK